MLGSDMPEWNAEAAEWYASKYGDYPTNKLAVNALELAEHVTIVDIGCGTGAALRHAASQVNRGKLIGIDPVPRMLEIAADLTKAHTAHERIEYRLGSAESLPVEDDSADWVLAFDSLDHWQDVDQGLSEAKRILRPQGRFALVKDKGVPSAHGDSSAMASKLEAAGFVVKANHDVSQEDVAFYLLVCEIGK